MKYLRLIFTIIPIFLQAQPLFEHQIVPFDGLGSDFFGVEVAVSDSFLFVTSLRYSNHTENSVYVYKINDDNFDFEYKILPSDTQQGTFGMLFGGKLLFKDGQLFVGAEQRRINNIPVGAVYLFEYENNTWVEKQIILPPEPYSFSAFFPSFISKYNEYLLIGADHYDTDFENSGKVFLYRFIDDKYELYQEFSPFDEKENQLFGHSGEIKNNTILIGSSYDSTGSGIFSGSVYVYFREDSLWTFNKKYEPKPNSQFLSLGTSLTINDNYVFVGTAGHPSYNLPGKVYIYNYSEPVLEFAQIIETGDNYFNDRFGGCLYSKGDSLLVGALFDTVKNKDCGTAYLFVNDKGKWYKKYKVYPSDEINTSGFGAAGILTEDKIFVGAHLTRVNGIRTGSVFIYSSEPLSVVDESTYDINNFYLSQNYPNPFNPVTQIQFSVKQTGWVTVKVFDILGSEVAVLVNSNKEPGYYNVNFDASNLSSGVYIYTLQVNGFTDSKKMLLLK
ncbi:MAG TPA: T9SS type A sorting domain-containing protein [Ignavibacteriaceae bacterium]|nr:T9SS type A sorting domain-containing protein [Ignavibacteriaceae bacterium]